MVPWPGGLQGRGSELPSFELLDAFILETKGELARVEQGLEDIEAMLDCLELTGKRDFDGAFGGACSAGLNAFRPVRADIPLGIDLPPKSLWERL